MQTFELLISRHHALVEATSVVLAGGGSGRVGTVRSNVVKDIF